MAEPYCIIRGAQAADADAATAMWQEMAALHAEFDAEYWHWVPDAPERWREWFLEMVADEEVVCLVAQSEAEGPVGYLLAKITDRPSVMVERKCGSVFDLLVLPEHRNRGVGSQLMHEAASRLRAKGAEVLSLSVAAGNLPAARFYERLGMRVVQHSMFMRLSDDAPAP
jgi:ribosomal protein S18 acetylase RimI-like enzyme